MTKEKIEASKRIVEETKRLYALVLTRPLDDKQLTRPPFKFIQELVKSLINEAKILRDVFNPTDFGDRGIKHTWDKSAKIEFVQRLIDFAANNKQPVMGCLATKVVAGLEPNKTNELLQSLARIAQSRQSLGGSGHQQRRPRTFTKPPVVRATGSAASQGAKPSPTSSAGSFVGPRAHNQAVTEPDCESSANLDEPDSTNEPNASQTPTGDADKQSSMNRAKISMANNHNNQPEPRERPKQAPQQVVSSESDIAKGLQHLRSRLKSLRSTMTELSKLEEGLLRDSLVMVVTASKMVNGIGIGVENEQQQ